MSTLPNLENDFIDIPLVFEKGTYFEVFARKNNKTVMETLEHKRYKSIQEDFVKAHPDLLEMPLGQTMQTLKRSYSSIYLRFLNKYGDLKYSSQELLHRWTSYKLSLKQPRNTCSPGHITKTSPNG